ncbi:MAG: DUF4956 domain-containing protein [Gemmatimonadetes bacterium]|nr:DUF4956 domain-containing protein [Gemmatimonadota bacterium]
MSRSPLRRLWDNLAARTLGYYALLLAAVLLLWRYVPGAAGVLLLSQSGTSFLTGGVSRSNALETMAANAPTGAMSQMTSAATAMIVAALLCLPVAWLYILTRRKKGFRQSVVHTLIVLPVVVGGVVVLVKSSLALAFSLAGIVAAVRFRNTLEDSKDAVYIFLVTAVGLAAGVDPPVALAISLIFNVVILWLWYTDFGRTSAVFEGTVAQQRLDQARQFAGRQSSFITKLDDEILKSLSAEQLEVVAERALKRRRQAMPEWDTGESEPNFDVLLRVRTHNPEEARRATERVLADHLKKWRLSGVQTEDDGMQVVEYALRLRKNVTPNVLRDALEELGSPHIVGVEVD